MHEKAELITNLLSDFPKLDHVFNPLSDYDSDYDAHELAPEVRRTQFQSYLNSRINKARIVIVGESLSYMDAKFTGIPMVDESLILGRKVSAPFASNAILDVKTQRTSRPEILGYHGRLGNYVSTALYNFLYQRDIDPHHVMTWNAFPFHTHNVGDRLSDRPVKQYEVEAAHNIHREFFNVFSDCHMITMGKAAHVMLDELGIENESIPHPAECCIKLFTDGLARHLISSFQLA